MIWSLLAIVLGEALLTVSLSLLLCLFALFAVINAIYTPLVEEPGLAKRFKGDTTSTRDGEVPSVLPLARGRRTNEAFMLQNLRRLLSSHGSAVQPPTPPCGCDQDPVEALKQMFVDFAQGSALAGGRDPATRPVFLRLHGVAHGTFAVSSELPPDLKVGVFQPKSEYPIWVRFSSDLQPGDPDFQGTIGIGIKLFGVQGEKLLTPEHNARTHDFILQNHDVFFVDTAKDMCEFTCLALNGKDKEYIAAHPVTGQVLAAMAKTVDSVLASPYWSVLPYRLGEGRYVKYKLEPEAVPADDSPADYKDPFYLRADLHRRLKNREARFRFLVQLQTNEADMPLDRATVQWSEEASKPLHVATLVLPAQDLDTRGQSTYGENLAFNPWHTLREHEPMGSIAQARKVVYQASAEVRRNFNGVPVGEPVEPRPAQWHPGTPYPPPKDTTIVRAAIHPAIGVARVGNSRAAEPFIGPEVTDPCPEEPGFYRDADKCLRRQAARFRIYGFNAAGEVVRELTPGWASIRWKVHVANRKASWYRWQMALDIPEAAGLQLPRRNKGVTGSQRRSLEIDGGKRTIEGKDIQGEQYQFRGKFVDTDVYLGELRTDSDGHLLFLGGHGLSASPQNKPIFTEGDDNSFINADGWYDDTCDGPVTAEVSIEGHTIKVDSAWVITAPPNYAPAVKGVRTLYDLLFDLSVQQGWRSFPEKVSFQQHVYPILLRLADLQWVNKGFATQFGHGCPNDFRNPAYVEKLAYKPPPGAYDTYAELRQQVMLSFRDPSGLDNNQLPWPWIYGDAMGLPPAPTPRQNAALSPTQYRILQTWASGHFESDWDPNAAVPRQLSDVPLAERPAMLDRAALDFCLADAFHPGCEVTWPVRHASLFSGAFRIRHREGDTPEPDYGDVLTPEVAQGADGPLHAQGPGGLTRWMGLPWQADTAWCRAAYPAPPYHYDDYIPTFWPARVPNHVLTEANYNLVMDTNQDRELRRAAFAARMNWDSPLQGTTAETMAQMVVIFGAMGLVEVRPGVRDDQDFPETIMVASFGQCVQQPAAPGAPPQRRKGRGANPPLPVRYPGRP